MRLGIVRHFTDRNAGVAKDFSPSDSIVTHQWSSLVGKPPEEPFPERGLRDIRDRKLGDGTLDGYLGETWETWGQTGSSHSERDKSRF